MELQDIIGELNAALKENEPDTFAGLWIEHGTANDDFGAVALFTQNGEQTIRRYSWYVEDGPLAEMVEIRSATKRVFPKSLLPVGEG